MKAIKLNNRTWEVIGERGDYWTVKDVNGKVNVAAKRNGEVIEVEGFGEKKYTHKPSAKKLAEKYEITAHHSYTRDEWTRIETELAMDEMRNNRINMEY